jgi:glycosyltransferase involved in cell wall biosynthesis
MDALSIAMIGTRGLPANYGGVERAVEELSARLVERGHAVTVYGRSGYAEPVACHRGIRQVVLPQVDTKHLEAITHSTLAALHALRKHHDVIHFHATGPAMLSALTRVGRLPTVATVQGLDWQREKWGRTARSVLRVAAKLAAVVPDETIVVSRGLARDLTALGATRLTYIPNGVEVDDEAGDARVGDLECGRFVLFLGRLVPEKRVIDLLDAYRRVPGDLPLAIVGPSSHSDAYVQEVEARAVLDARVRVIGPRYGPEKRWLLRNARLFIQPSTVEGLPIALLEALAYGIPTLVSDLPENLEPVTVDGVVYSHVFRRRDVADLAVQLHSALEDERAFERAKTIQSAVSRVYDWEAIAETTERVYARAVARASARAQ